MADPLRFTYDMASLGFSEQVSQQAWLDNMGNQEMSYEVNHRLDDIACPTLVEKPKSS